MQLTDAITVSDETEGDWKMNHMSWDNDSQRVACQAYPNSDLLPIDLKNGLFDRGELTSCGNELFKFIYDELSDLDNDHHSQKEEAIRRLYEAMGEIEACIIALEQYDLLTEDPNHSCDKNTFEKDFPNATD